MGHPNGQDEGGERAAMLQVLSRLPSVEDTVGCVGRLVDFLEQLLNEAAASGRPTVGTRADEVKRQLQTIAAGVWPLAPGLDAPSPDTDKFSRLVVAEAAWDEVELAKQRGKPETAYRGRHAWWRLLDDGLSVARGAVELAVVIALTQEIAGHEWPTVLLGLVLNGGRAKGKLQTQAARNIREFWRASWDGDLEDRIWNLHGRLRSQMVVDPSDDAHVQRGAHRGALKSHVESLSRHQRRLTAAIRRGDNPAARLARETGARCRLRQLLGGNVDFAAWYVRVMPKALRWEWLGRYIACLAAAAHGAEDELEQRRRHWVGSEIEEIATEGEVEPRHGIPLTPYKHWHGFKETLHGRRQRKA